MKKKYCFTGFSLISFVFFYACSSIKSLDNKQFTLKDAYYQSWIVNENEKGTNIYIDLSDVAKEVEIDSIIFRGFKLPALREDKDGLVHLKSTLNIGMSKIQTENVVIKDPDQLIYRYRGIKHSYILKNIRRKNMKYY
jgi:hypothetical protein